jgi:hypothetical protein
LAVDAVALFALAMARMPRAAGGEVSAALWPAAALAALFAVLLVLGTRWGEGLGVRVALGACATAAFAWAAWSRVLDPRDREALRAALVVGVPGRGEA